ncbi:unnamed protein product [Lactuca virosa]|uniref:26S proteasome non-ATPase regulatory subunit 1 homolog n=1 Tax=Lactuca virosa TaxID=75947 RepID=A0AAU9LP98_9ASTR|nr:unnamed protein product [Lactuca virosa]
MLLYHIAWMYVMNLWVGENIRMRADPYIINRKVRSVAMKSRACQDASIYAHALMHTCTSLDGYLVQNQVGMAKRWAEFSAIAGLSVIYKGNSEKVQSLMDRAGSDLVGPPYVQGGALYALGFLNANDDGKTKGFIMDILKESEIEVVWDGACLGLDLVALGSADDDTYDEILGVASCVIVGGDGTGVVDSGLVADISLGLVNAGILSERTYEMVAHARETQYEKQIRGLALGASLTVYGREEEVGELVDIMIRDGDPIIRCRGIYALALAYSGTTNKKAIQQLLHFAISDASDDVRRTAVLALGFVLCSEPEQTTHLISPFSQSYDPHFRYGAVMTLGISCSGTCSHDAISVLQTLLFCSKSRIHRNVHGDDPSHTRDGLPRRGIQVMFCNKVDI